MSFLNNILPSRDAGAVASRDNGSVEVAETIKPVFEINETPEAYGATVYLPGVAKDGLDISIDDSEIRIVGRRAWKQPEGWSPVYRESTDAAYELVLTHDNAIDADKIVAELRDGVLKVSLPKHEAVKPRKIAIN